MRLSPFVCVCASLLVAWLSAAQVHAQVLVYEIEFKDGKGVNYQPFDGGYFVAPLLGGKGSFLLTSSESARTYTQSDSSGLLFTAVNNGAKKSVVSASTGTGTASGTLVAIGDIDHTIHVNGPTVSLSLMVAKSLRGTSVSADNESTVSSPAVDGSIGSAGISEIRLKLNEGETNRANNQGLSLSQTMDQMVLVLQRDGFGPEPTPTTSTGTATSSATTTGNPAAPAAQ